MNLFPWSGLPGCMRRAFWLFALVFTTAHTLPVHAQCIPALEPVGTYGGLDGFVHTLTPLSNGSVFLAGDFTIAGRQSVTSPAIWNGTQFQSLAPITDGVIFTSTIHNNQIVIGGSFRLPNLPNSITIAAWDGASWNPLGLQPSGTVFKLFSTANGLLAGGDFSLFGSTEIIHLASFASSSSTWQRHSIQPDDTVFAIATLDNLLLIGGDFYAVNGTVCRNIALISNNYPIALDRGLDRTVYAVAFFENSIIAGGNFESDFRSITPGVARFENGNWHALAGGLSGDVYEFREIGGKLYAAGALPTGVVYLENDTWHSGGNPIDGIAYSVAPGPTGPVAGGLFGHAGPYPAGGFVPLVNDEWTPLYPGTDGPITCSCMYNGQLTVAGNFTSLEGVPCRIARYTGSEWIPIPTELDGEILSMVEWDGYLVAVGNFLSIDDGLVTRCVAKWDGVRWSRFSRDFSSFCRLALVIQGEIVVGTTGGALLNEDGSQLGGVASMMYFNRQLNYWQGYWSPNFLPRDILLKGNDLWMAGESLTAAVTARINNSWMQPSGPRGTVRALATDGVHIFAGGSFTTFVPSPGATAQPCTNLVSWNGTRWSEVSLALDGPVYSLAWFNGSLYIGGNFVGTPIYPRGGLLRITDQGLLERPNYFDGTVSFLQPVSNKLLVSGSFGLSNSQPSPYIAWLSCPACPADFNTDDQVDIFDYIDFVELFAIGDPRCDFNQDSQFDLFDYLDFTESFARGC